MAAVKLIITALIAIFAVQVLAVEQSVFENAIKKLMALHDGAIAELTKNLAGVIDKVQDSSNEVVGNVEKRCEGIFNEINGLEKKALDLGLDIAKCVTDNKALLGKMCKEAIASAKRCGDNAVTSAKTAMEKGKKNLPDLRTKADALIAEWNACTGPLCKIPIIVKVGGVTAQSAVVSAGVIAAVALEFVKITSTAATCTAGIIHDFEKHTGEIMKAILDCVSKIMTL